MWVGDFAEAERHHAIAAHVHEQTELYEAGSGLLAAASLLREKGGPLDPRWNNLHASQETGGQGMVGVVRTALLTLATGADARVDAAATLRASVDDIARGHIWTTLGYLTLLAHLSAAHELPEFAEPLLAELTPFRDRIAVIGQVGLAGPVSLATARLHALRGDRQRALEDVALARGMAERSGGTPTLLRCRLLECELAESAREQTRLARALVADAATLGMSAVADAAEALARPAG
jgi:hypothetical protein